VCAGLIITVVRFACSCVREQELTCMRRAGVAVDLVEAADFARRP